MVTRHFPPRQSLRRRTAAAWATPPAESNVCKPRLQAREDRRVREPAPRELGIHVRIRTWISKCGRASPWA